jgi:stress response protein YsnF
MGYAVVDQDGASVGRVETFWVDPSTDRPAFVGVRAGDDAAVRVLPVRDADLDEDGRTLRVPYAADAIRSAPAHAVDEVITKMDERAVLRHYRVGALPAEIPLHAERPHVSKRVVQAGGVRLRKVTRTRIEHVPVEVRYEEIVVERVGPREALGEMAASGALPEAPFEEGSTLVREYREEPVVTKTTEIVGGVRADRRTDVVKERVATDVRREDVEVDRLDP